MGVGPDAVEDMEEPQNEEEMYSDSDSAPEEESIAKVKDIFAEDDVKQKKEIILLKKQAKEARRQRHEKNRLQQLEKNTRLETLEQTRLPTNLLAAVANEEKAPKTTTKKKRKKRPSKKPNDRLSQDLGLKVKSIEKQVKKHAEIASIAINFREKSLGSQRNIRTTSVAQRKMFVKRAKGGKNVKIY